MNQKLLLTLFSVILSVIFVACTPSGGENEPSETDEAQSMTTVGDKVTGTAETTASDPTPCEHSFGDFSLWRAPTCEQEGLNERVCTKCGEKEYEKIAKTAHTEVMDPAVQSTCQKSGLTEGSHCSFCNKVIVSQKVVEKLAHEYVDGVCKSCNIPTPSEGLSFKKLSDGNYAVKGLGTCRDRIIVIPETFEGGKVVELSEYALYHIENEYAPDMIVIPDSIKNVRYNAIFFNKFFKIVVGENATFAAESVCAMGGCEIICLSQKGISSTAITYSHKDAPFVVHKGPDSLCKTDKDGFVFLESGKGLFLCGYTGQNKNVVLPDSFEGKKYVIAPYCFMADKNIESVKLGNGVLRLGEGVFTNSYVKSVDLSGSLTSLANNTFMGCKNLESIVITDNITDIGDFVFVSSGLKTATVGKNVTHIGASAFEVKHDALLDTLYYNAVNCQKIDGMSFNGFRYVVIGKDVSVIPEKFMNKHRSLLSVTFEENSVCTRIMADAFSVTGIREIELPPSVTHLYGAFEYCHSLERIIINSEKLTVSAAVFENCGRDGTGIVLIVGAQVSELPSGFFKKCNVKDIVFDKNSVCKIIHKGFSDQKLTGITLPASIEEFDDGSFDLNTLKFDKNSKNFKIEGACLIDLKNSRLIKVMGKDYSLPDYVKIIGKGAFEESGLTHIYIPDTVEVMEKGCLDCPTLTSLSLPFVGVDRSTPVMLLELFSSEPRYTWYYGVTLNAGASNQATYYVPMDFFDLTVRGGDVTQSLVGLYWLKTLRLSEQITGISQNAFVDMRDLEALYFGGTAEKWEALKASGCMNNLSPKVHIVVGKMQ